MNLVPFRLYGLPGCPHCASAENFLRSKRVPAELIIALGDPIVAEGVKQLTGAENYPILVSRATNEIITGWKPEEYERVERAYTALSGAGAPNLFGGELQPGSEVSPTSAEDTPRAN